MIFVVVVLVIGFGYSIYSSLFSTASQKADRTQKSLIISCQNSLGKSIIFQNFANRAAAARRASAVNASQRGDKVAAENDLAAAHEYEQFAEQYDKLTVHDCAEFYDLDR